MRPTRCAARATLTASSSTDSSPASCAARALSTRPSCKVSPSGKTTVISPIAPNLYTYTETAYPLPWTLAEEDDTIAGYECHKATATYGGRDWTAWYTTEVPVSFGSWKLTGLPGLAHTFRVHSLQISETGRDVLLQRLATPQQPHCGTGNHHGQRQHRSVCHPQ
ncbi:MAG: GLPGLI family protein [Duncaniella sp.]|nr:GLPGLI family protein [Duncaniella sp.]